MSAACRRGDLRQARPAHPTAGLRRRTMRQGNRPSPADPAGLPRYHRRGGPRPPRLGAARGGERGGKVRGVGGGGGGGGKKGGQRPPPLAAPGHGGGFKGGPPREPPAARGHG